MRCKSRMTSSEDIAQVAYVSSPDYLAEILTIIVTMQKIACSLRALRMLTS